MLKLVIDWGYERYEFRLWSKLEGINDYFFEINIVGRAADVVSYAIGNNTEGHLYIQHNVKDINVKVIEP